MARGTGEVGEVSEVSEVDGMGWVRLDGHIFEGVNLTWLGG
jgi:hypothetical protein